MRYHNTTKDDMNNGDGFRVVLWVSGRRHRCKGCQNPITWNPDDGLVLTSSEVSEIYTELDKGLRIWHIMMIVVTRSLRWMYVLFAVVPI